LWAIDSDIHRGSGQRIVFHLRGDTILVHHLHEVPAVGADKFSARIVEGHSELAATTLRAEVHQPRVEGKITAMEFDLRRIKKGEIADRTGVTAERAVDALVGPPLQGIWKRLDIELRSEIAEPRENERVNIGFPVAVGVLEIEEIRRGEDEDAAIPAGDTGWPREVFGEDDGAIVAAIAIGVLEELHATKLLLALFGVVAHLDDVETAVFIEGHGDRTFDERLGCHELEMKTGLHRARRDGAGRRNRLRTADISRRHCGLRCEGNGSAEQEE